jgi:elongation factor P--(R)-beta-lysine ligase
LGRASVTTGDWRPTAPLANLRSRAELLRAARQFFAERAVLEVETAQVSRHAVTDLQIDSLALHSTPARFLHTSPEYPMKRLLAHGSGDIYQICRVFRADERSRLHNPEFTMIEWYRLGFDLPQIMQETSALAQQLLRASGRFQDAVETVSYEAAFMRALHCDPFAASDAALRKLSCDHGLARETAQTSDRDALLDFLVATCIGPTLGTNQLTCLHHYPASQAALAQLDMRDPRTALRFELYGAGIELANGYVELANATEQARRFQADIAARAARGKALLDPDQHLLAALTAGLPPCAGVALGFDRIAMLALNAASIDEVIAFPWERA